MRFSVSACTLNNLITEENFIYIRPVERKSSFIPAFKKPPRHHRKPKPQAEIFVILNEENKTRKESQKKTLSSLSSKISFFV